MEGADDDEGEEEEAVDAEVAAVGGRGIGLTGVGLIGRLPPLWAGAQASASHGAPLPSLRLPSPAASTGASTTMAATQLRSAVENTDVGENGRWVDAADGEGKWEGEAQPAGKKGRHMAAAACTATMETMATGVGSDVAAERQ